MSMFDPTINTHTISETREEARARVSMIAAMQKAETLLGGPVKIDHNRSTTEYRENGQVVLTAVFVRQ